MDEARQARLKAKIKMEEEASGVEKSKDITGKESTETAVV
jgi:hypothetical protein